MSEANERVQCPYNFSHIILKHRMASHLIKCRKQHPTEKFATCPFNSTHDVLAIELQYHLEICPDRKLLESCVNVKDKSNSLDEIPVQIEMPFSSENWDEEENSGGSYLDATKIALENQMILRQPVGMSKTNRRAFFQNEVQRFTCSVQEKLTNKI